MKSLSVATVIEKNRLSSEVPFVVVLDIGVIDPATGARAETLRLTNNAETLTWQGNLYQPCPFEIELRADQNAQNSISLSIKDYSQAVMARMQAYGGGTGFTVTVSVVNAGNLAQPPEIVEHFEVIGASAANYVCTFQLGAENNLMRAFPRRRQTRDFCQWRYKDAQTCRYALRRAWTFRNDGTHASVGGGNYIQMSDGTDIAGRTFCVAAAVRRPVSNPSPHFTMNLNNSTASRSQFARFEWNEATGAIQVRSGSTAGVTPTIGPALGNGWTLIWFTYTIPAGEGLNTWQVWLNSDSSYTVGSTRAIEWSSPSATEGTTPALYYPTLGVRAKPTNWLRQTDNLRTSPWLWTSTLTATETDGPVYGGDATCDLTLQGANGCAAHFNTLNFGGFPGLNVRLLTRG
jgi:phage-related protein